jgi:predicted phage terminase large subunit-like protein
VYLIYRGEYFIAEVYRRQMVFPVGQRAVISICEKYRDMGYPADEVLIENKSNGIDLINNLKSNPDFPWPLIPIDPEADKITRMESQAGAVEAGKCFLPSSAGWLPDFELEVEQFPLGFKDQIDQFSQFLKRMKLAETRHWATLYQTKRHVEVELQEDEY